MRPTKNVRYQSVKLKDNEMSPDIRIKQLRALKKAFESKKSGKISKLIQK